jgi:hypothetical protein
LTAFDKWWAECVQRRPGLMNEQANFSMTIDQLKSNLKRAFDAGWARAKSEPSLEKALDGIFGRFLK